MSREFSYAEIAATEKDESQFLTCIRGKVYDLKDFVSKHPGTPSELVSVFCVCLLKKGFVSVVAHRLT
jgi:cytochrome b involved in lipid metabolism